MTIPIDNLPKVLIVSAEPFNMERGCGITLSNLFKGWPAEKIMSVYWLNVDPDYSVCAAQYMIEHSWPSPLKMLSIKKLELGQNQTSQNDSLPDIAANNHCNVRIALINIDRKIGISGLLKTIKVQKNVKESIERFNPQILYCALSGRNAISVISQVLKIAHLPVAIHVFDDWIANKASLSLVEALLHPVTEARFKKINRMAKIRMAIGDYMCREYKTRYRNEYLPFQNAPDPEIWIENGRNSDYSRKEPFCFRFTGNVYSEGNLQALLHFSDAVEMVASSGKRISFELYTTRETINLYSELFAKNTSTKFLPTVLELRAMASLCGSSDGLVIVCNFDESGMRMLGMSMPTKLPTSMLSGVPLFVYAPTATAMSDFVSTNKIGYVVATPMSVIKLAQHIEIFITGIYDRESSAVRARKLALDRFTSAIVRPQFQSTLSSIANINTKSGLNNE